MTVALSTARLSLEPFSDRFLTDTYVAWLNDEETVRYSEQRHRSHSVESCRTFVVAATSPPNLMWAIVRKEMDDHIGNVTASVDERNGVADLGMMIGSANCRGRGYGVEAWACAKSYLLGERNLRRVEAGAMSENAAMLAVFQSTGMTEEGRRKGHFLLDGRPVDMVLVAQDRS
ncbi:MAG: GNAT family N-acetyltransferase [Pseudomonadota bacterium]